MSETFGLPLYQEQTLSIVRKIGKFNWEETTNVRKAVAKSKGNEYLQRFWQKFKDGAEEQGIEETEAKEIWNLICTMGTYQMNKAHTYSYAVISYWCAYLKTHHLMEFAAANLRNARTEESAVELLRELAREGVEYVPFDLELSQANWSVQKGKLYGGLEALHGYAEVKAARFVKKRELKTLTEKEKETALKAANPFSEIFPFHTRYQHLYDDENKEVAGKLCEIDDLEEGIPHGHAKVFLAELVYKGLRNLNEEVNIKKRDGKIEHGQLEYLDLRFRDDSGTIGGRVSAYDYLRIGADFPEEGAHLMIRAKFFHGIRYAFVTKWRKIDE